jgi:hypothetical protein
VLSRREKLLLAALLWTAAVAAAGVTVYLAGEGRAATTQRIRLAEREVASLAARMAGGHGAGPGADAPARAGLEERIADARGRLYAPGEIDPYRFGIIIRDLLLAQGLEIARYQTVEQGGSTDLEFSVQGSARALSGFLEQVSRAPRWWDLSFLSVRTAGDAGAVQAVLRISYEQAEKSGG